MTGRELWMPSTTKKTGMQNPLENPWNQRENCVYLVGKKVEIPKMKGGKISKKSPEIIASLLAKIEENASTTLLELKTLVFRDFNLDVTINTIKNWLDAELISVKNIRGKIVNVISPENKVKRANYLQSFAAHMSILFVIFCPWRRFSHRVLKAWDIIKNFSLKMSPNDLNTTNPRSHLF